MSETSDRIVVSKEKLARCKWCGSPQSNEWVISDKGDIYCTTECMLAANIGKTKLSAYATLLCSLLILIPYFFVFITGSFGVLWFGFELLLYGICFFILGVAGFATMNEGKKYQDRKGKYSGVPPIECEYCRHPNPPNSTRCLNCDATLTSAPFMSDAIPPWIHKHRPIKGINCPYCSARYSYGAPMISDDGHVNCQNCNQIFLLPYSVRESSMGTTNHSRRLKY